MAHLITTPLGIIMIVALGSWPAQAQLTQKNSLIQSSFYSAHSIVNNAKSARSPCLGIDIGGSASAQVDEQDSLALVALYEATNGDNWTNKANWLTGPVASWHGVQVVGDSVVVLDLNFNELNGVIPHELGDLTNLGVLELAGNELNESIPPELGRLANLGCLDLSYTQLSGAIPPELGSLTNLGALVAFNTLLSGPIPPELGNLTNLSFLALVENQLSGSIPPELGNLTNLGYLSFYGSKLSGSIPPELGKLGNLTSLVLTKNQLNGSIPPELGDLTNLRGLYLSDNQLSGPIPMTLTSLDNLNTFDFSNTNLCESDDPDFQTWLQGISNVSSNGVCTATATEDEHLWPTEYTLSQSYPNPFYTNTRIRYGLPQSELVLLEVYDIQGRVAKVIVKANQPAGWHEITFEGGMLPSGVYFYRFEAGDFHAVRQMVLLR